MLPTWGVLVAAVIIVALIVVVVVTGVRGQIPDAGASAAEAGAGDIPSCVEEGAFRPWATFTTAAAQAAAVGGTPTVYVNGTVVPNALEDLGTAVQVELDARG